MSRKGSVARRRNPLDSKYGDNMVAKVLNSLMYNGKKSKAEKVMYNSLDLVKEKTGKDPLEVFHQALDNIKPNVEVRPRRVGGATYQVPMEVSPSRRQSLAIRWFLDAARKRSEKSMTDRLTAEILDAAEKRGAAIKKKEDTHRMAESNRAFAHYRW